MDKRILRKTLLTFAITHSVDAILDKDQSDMITSLMVKLMDDDFRSICETIGDASLNLQMQLYIFGHYNLNEARFHLDRAKSNLLYSSYIRTHFDCFASNGADCLETVIGVLVLNNVSIEYLAHCIFIHYLDIVNGLYNNIFTTETKNFIMMLNEYCAKSELAPPVDTYNVDSCGWECTLSVEGKVISRGIGDTKKAAKHVAAKLMYEKISEDKLVENLFKMELNEKTLL